VALGREVLQRQEASEHTAELVDTEVRRMTNEAYERAQRVIRANVDKLHVLAQALLEHESLSREQVESLLGPAAPGPRPAEAPPARPVVVAALGR
jgi:cell division protease FtsH